MTSLHDLIQEMGLQDIPFVKAHRTAMQRWLEGHSQLFSRVCEHKPTSSPHLHLLGLLTKSHIEASALYEQHARSTQQMQQVLNDSLGDEHADKFTNQSAEDLILITHLWMYTQGYLHMDFSLAHDHAEQTQATLQHELVITRIDVDAFRTELMQSFYLGKMANPASSNSLWTRIKRLLSL